MTRYADVLATYKRIRPLRLRINNTLVGTLSKQAIDECARALGLLRRGVLVFDSEAEMDILMDYCLYHYRSKGRNVVQVYLEDSTPPPGPEERAVLEAMLRAHYSLFQVLDAERGVGVTVLDVLRGDTSFLADINFSKTAPKGAILAARVIPWDDFLMTSGAFLPVFADAADKVRAGLVRTFGPEMDFHRITPRQEDDLATLIIRACLAAGTSSNIAFATPGERPSQGQLTGATPARPRANRNDPCPCGSGKKYKSCCGRR